MNTDCLVKVATEFGTDLSSRARGKNLRTCIAGAIDGGCSPATIDFQSVRTVSTSFADEAFAVLVGERGEEWFALNVKLVAASECVAESIADAISYRCEPA